MSDDTQGELLPSEGPPKDEAGQPRFEDLMRSLEDVVGQLEGGALPLEAALEAFESGSKLATAAQGILDAAQLRVTRLVSSADGGLAEVPFDDVGA